MAEMLRSINGGYLTAYSPAFAVEFSTAEHVEIMTNFLMLGFDEPEKISQVDDIIDVSGMQENPAPSVFTNSLGMVWISDIWIEEGKVHGVFMLGPVFMDDISVQYIEKELNCMNLSVHIKHKFLQYIQDIPVVSLNRLYDYGIMLHFCITGKKVLVSDFNYPVTETAKEKESFFQAKHGTYAAEQEILQLVENGNLQYKELYNQYASAGEMSRVSNGTFLRQEKNTVLTFVVLCSRAAIRGGVASETALTLCDRYMCRVENVMDLSTLTQLNREMFHDFVTRVYRQKQKNEPVSPQIRKVCDYIRLYPEEKNSIHKLAQMIGYADYYFSNKFKQETGESVRDYIMECRIEKAKSMLRETSLSVSEISDRLGFGTQSYFGELFRKRTGKSPGEYREHGEESD